MAKNTNSLPIYECDEDLLVEKEIDEPQWDIDLQVMDTKQIKVMSLMLHENHSIREIVSDANEKAFSSMSNEASSNAKG